VNNERRENPKHTPTRCTAKSKGTGQRCRRFCAPGWTVCHYHGQGGGRPPKHGLYSALSQAEVERVDYLAQRLDVGSLAGLVVVKVEGLLARLDGDTIGLAEAEAVGRLVRSLAGAMKSVSEVRDGMKITIMDGAAAQKVMEITRRFISGSEWRAYCDALNQAAAAMGAGLGGEVIH